LGAITTSVTVVPGPLANADALDGELAVLRRQFPRSTIDRYLDRMPRLGARVLLAPTAVLAGRVELGDDVSIWYGAVLRGDLAPVVVGARSNIQDGTVMHVGDDAPCVVGADTVVGHRAMLHACQIEDGCLIGMQATILDGAVVGAGSIVGAGALVTQRTIIPPRSLVLGSPARVVRTLDEGDVAAHRALAAKYVRLKENYLRDALRPGK
jgi:carbonic anhydrase/acetyltransferase-like protein (isoleucine patch superfamily)